MAETTPPEHFFSYDNEELLLKMIKGVSNEAQFEVVDRRIYQQCKSMDCCSASSIPLITFHVLSDSELRMQLAVIGELMDFITFVLSVASLDGSLIKETLRRRLDFVDQLWRLFNRKKELVTAKIITRCHKKLQEIFAEAETLEAHEDCANRCSKIAIDFQHIAEVTAQIHLVSFRTDDKSFENPYDQMLRLAKSNAGSHAILINALSLATFNSLNEKDEAFIELGQEVNSICSGLQPGTKSQMAYTNQSLYEKDVLGQAFDTIAAKWPASAKKNSQVSNMTPTLEQALTTVSETETQRPMNSQTPAELFYSCDTGLISTSPSIITFLVNLAPHILCQRNLAKMADSIKVILVYGGEALLTGTRRDAFKRILDSLANYLSVYKAFLKEFEPTSPNGKNTVRFNQIKANLKDLLQLVQKLEDDVAGLISTTRSNKDDSRKAKKAAGFLLQSIRFHDKIVGPRWPKLQLQPEVRLTIVMHILEHDDTDTVLFDEDNTVQVSIQNQVPDIMRKGPFNSLYDIQSVVCLNVLPISAITSILYHREYSEASSMAGISSSDFSYSELPNYENPFETTTYDVSFTPIKQLSNNERAPSSDKPSGHSIYEQSVSRINSVLSFRHAPKPQYYPWITLAASGLLAAKHRHISQLNEQHKPDVAALLKDLYKQHPELKEAAITFGDKNTSLSWISLVLKDYFSDNHTWIVFAFHGKATASMFTSTQEIRNLLSLCPMNLIRNCAMDLKKSPLRNCTIMVVGEGPFGNLAHMIRQECLNKVFNEPVNQVYSISFSPIPKMEMERNGWLGIHQLSSNVGTEHISVYLQSDSFTETVALIDLMDDISRRQHFSTLSDIFNDYSSSKGDKLLSLKNAAITGTKIATNYVANIPGRVIVLADPPKHLSKFTEPFGTLEFIHDISLQANHLSPQRFRVTTEEKNLLQNQIGRPGEVRLAIIFVPVGTKKKSKWPKEVNMKLVGSNLLSINLLQLQFEGGFGKLSDFQPLNYDSNSMEIKVTVTNWEASKELVYRSYVPHAVSSKVSVVVAESASGIASDLDLAQLLFSASGKMILQCLSSGFCGTDKTDLPNTPILTFLRNWDNDDSSKSEKGKVDSILRETILCKTATKQCALKALERMNEEVMSKKMNRFVGELDTASDRWLRVSLIAMGIALAVGGLFAAIFILWAGIGALAGAGLAAGSYFLLVAKKYRGYVSAFVEFLELDTERRETLQVLEDQEKVLVTEWEKHQKCSGNCTCFPKITNEKYRASALVTVETVFKPIYELRRLVNSCVVVTLIGPKNCGKTRAFWTMLNLRHEERVKSPLGVNVEDSTDRLFVCGFQLENEASVIYVDPPGITEAKEIRKLTEKFAETSDFALFLASRDTSNPDDPNAHSTSQRDFESAADILSKLPSHVQIRMAYSKCDEGYNDYEDRVNKDTELLNHNKNSLLPDDLKKRIGQPMLTTFHPIPAEWDWDLDTPNQVHTMILQFVAEKLNEVQACSLTLKIEAGEGKVFDEPPYRMNQETRLKEIIKSMKNVKWIGSASSLLFEAEELGLLDAQVLKIVEAYRDQHSRLLRTDLTAEEVGQLKAKLGQFIPNIKPVKAEICPQPEKQKVWWPF
ncbi:hypothetical protein HDU84_008310 [Entophlyctis sp. JEL0112]|nr:hypothetical protein HDU84_008310 [Entophlyctis sp. JEL0112]